MTIYIKDYEGIENHISPEDMSLSQRITVKLYMIKNIILGHGVMYRISITGKGTICIQGNKTRKYSIYESKILDPPEV